MSQEDKQSTDFKQSDHEDSQTQTDNQLDEDCWIHGDPVEQDEIDENVNDTSSIAFKRRKQKRFAKPKSKLETLKSNLTVFAAVAAGVVVSTIKLIASVLTGSAAMFSEGLHSVVDTTNDALMMVGTKASKKAPDITHPFGYGKMLYFYVFVVSVVIFFLGGGFTLLTGFQSLLSNEHEITNPTINYIVLALCFIVEGISFRIALRDVNSQRGDMSIREYIKQSKSPTSFTVLLEDSAALLGMLFAMLGITLTHITGLAFFDALASIAVGITMSGVGFILLRETRSLLVGEGLSVDEVNDIVHIVEADKAVIKCGRVLSMYFSPEDMLLTLDVTFDDELDEGDILQAIDRIEYSIIDEYPQCSSIFIEAESLNQVYRQRLDRKEAFEQAELESEQNS